MPRNADIEKTQNWEKLHQLAKNGDPDSFINFYDLLDEDKKTELINQKQSIDDSTYTGPPLTPLGIAAVYGNKDILDEAGQNESILTHYNKADLDLAIGAAYCHENNTEARNSVDTLIGQLNYHQPKKKTSTSLETLMHTERTGNPIAQAAQNYLQGRHDLDRIMRYLGKKDQKRAASMSDYFNLNSAIKRGNSEAVKALVHDYGVQPINYQREVYWFFKNPIVTAAKSSHSRAPTMLKDLIDKASSIYPTGRNVMGYALSSACQHNELNNTQTILEELPKKYKNPITKGLIVLDGLTGLLHLNSANNEDNQLNIIQSLCQANDRRLNPIKITFNTLMNDFLFKAINENKTHLAAQLVERKSINISKPRKNGETALQAATKMNQPGVVNAMLYHKGSQKAVMKDAEKALNLAKDYGYESLENSISNYLQRCNNTSKPSSTPAALFNGDTDTDPDNLQTPLLQGGSHNSP